MEKFYFIILLLFSFSFVSYVFADITIEGINVNLDKVTWNFTNSITVSNIFVQNNGITLKLDDASEQRKYNFFRSGSLTTYDISLVGFTSEKIDFTVVPGLTDAVLNVSGTKIDGVTLGNVVSSFAYDGTVNTININSATLVSIYFSNAPQAPQTGGGGSSGDRTAPTFNTFSVTGAKILQEDGTIGFGGILSQEIQLTNKMPTAIVETGNEIQLRVLLYENSGTSALQHIALYTNLHDKDRIDKSDTYIQYDKGKPITIVDKNGYLSDTKVSFVQRNNNVEWVFSLTFAKPMDTSNIIVRAWDIDRNSRDAIFLNAIKVEQAQLVPSEKPESQPEVKQESDLLKMDPEPLLSFSLLKQWSGYSEGYVPDEEFLKNLGLQGTKIPSWFKKSQVAKWVIEETISQRELLDTLKFFEKGGLLS
jgi:Fe-S cluster assembly iron-binding protein IscA